MQAATELPDSLKAIPKPEEVKLRLAKAVREAAILRGLLRLSKQAHEIVRTGPVEDLPCR